ncbi:hypothetical protein SASPL_129283 [Salvia splendens]|uniref:Uncharacterized protein n=1 Tax=Salvia splendens TaxID=180675 RepID=A0A8X8XCU7_SALSN|nr:hypothetical protein SASPL_129283 [Salvia splendens]
MSSFVIAAAATLPGGGAGAMKSPAGKLYSFSHPSVDALINRAAPSPAAKRRLPYGNDGDKFVMDAAAPPSLQQLVAADDFVIATDSFCDEEETQLASSIDDKRSAHSDAFSDVSDGCTAAVGDLVDFFGSGAVCWSNYALYIF